MGSTTITGIVLEQRESSLRVLFGRGHAYEWLQDFWSSAPPPPSRVKGTTNATCMLHVDLKYRMLIIKFDLTSH